MNNINWFMEKNKLIVWGTGLLGQKFAKIALESKIPIAYFVDSFNPHDTYSINDNSFQVYKPEKILTEEPESIHILVAVKNAEKIIEQLENWGFSEATHFRCWSSVDLIMRDALWRQQFSSDRSMNVGLFRQVEIETVNRCNHDCPFCPGNKHLDTRKLKIMDEALLDTILNELSELKFTGNIGLLGTGEPLLDPDIISRTKKVKETLPQCWQFFSTNGILLTLDIFKKITPYLDSIIINNYADSQELFPNILEIEKYMETHPELKGKVSINKRLKNEVLTTRGGYAPNKKSFSAPAITCNMPFEFLCIRSNGIVSLCCSDYLSHYKMGDLNLQSISEIWNGEEFAKIRKILMEQGRSCLELCKSCDVFFYVRN